MTPPAAVTPDLRAATGTPRARARPTASAKRAGSLRASMQIPTAVTDSSAARASSASSTPTSA